MILLLKVNFQQMLINFMVSCREMEQDGIEKNSTFQKIGREKLYGYILKEYLLYQIIGLMEIILKDIPKDTQQIF